MTNKFIIKTDIKEWKKNKKYSEKTIQIRREKDKTKLNVDDIKKMGQKILASHQKKHKGVRLVIRANGTFKQNSTLKSYDDDFDVMLDEVEYNNLKLKEGHQKLDYFNATFTVLYK